MNSSLHIAPRTGTTMDDGCYSLPWALYKLITHDWPYSSSETTLIPCGRQGSAPVDRASAGLSVLCSARDVQAQSFATPSAQLDITAFRVIPLRAGHGRKREVKCRPTTSSMICHL